MKICIECGSEIPDDQNLCKPCKEEIFNEFKTQKKKPMFIIGLFKFVFLLLFNPFSLWIGGNVMAYIYYGWPMNVLVNLLMILSFGIVSYSNERRKK